MGLKDFDSRKIKSWRYSQVGNNQKSQTFVDGHSGTRVDGTRDLILEKFLNSTEESKPNASTYDLESNPPSPQTFEAQGYTVTGKKDLIEEKFLDSQFESNAYASDLDPLDMPQSFEANGYTITGIRDIISSKFVNDPKTLLIGDDTIFEPNVDDTPLNSLTQQQNYTVDNFQGSYNITGKGAFDTGNLTELDALKGLSLIISNWADMVDAKTLISYKVARVGQNATHGHLEIPYSYKNFGSTATDAEPFSYGKLSPNIGWTVEIERGGDALGGIIKDYEKILESGDMWERFIEKQSDTQTMAEITRGSTKFLGEAPFNTFNSLDYAVALGSTAQPYRVGNFIQGVPRYSEHSPLINRHWYDSDSDIGAWQSDYDGPLFMTTTDDFHENSKMMYLYKSFILQSPHPQLQWSWDDNGINANNQALALGMLSNYWNSMTDPFPIAPAINVTKLADYGSFIGQQLAWVDSMLVYGRSTEDDAQLKYSTPFEKGSTVISSPHGKYNYFSKGAPRKHDGNFVDETLVELSKEAIEAEFSNIGQELPANVMNLRRRWESGPTPAAVSQSLGGEGDVINTLQKYSKNTEGLINRYSTLGFKQLVKAEKYEVNLLSPSERNLENKMALKDLNEPDTAVKDAFGEEHLPKPKSGLRKEMQAKVYAIGKQGMSVTTDENDIAPLKPVNKYGFRGQVNEDSNNSLFGDHVDKVNALPYGESNTDLDFVPLIFHDVYNKKDIQFRALFTEDITDTISPSWNPINYIGRTTAVYTYQNTARSISFGFTIFPKTKQEFPILLEKVNYLVGMCYPNLDDYFRASGPLIKLTAGDIVNSQLGFLSECSVTFPSSESPWETDAGLQFTKKIDVSIGFTYIGNNIPVAKGVHYNLDWLDGEHYTEEGVAWKTDADGKGGPTRRAEGKISKLTMQDIITDATPADPAHYGT